jgi:hypothetical protein
MFKGTYEFGSPQTDVKSIQKEELRFILLAYPKVL